LSEETRLRVVFVAGSKWSPRPLPIALCAWAFLATSCVQPLGPGFRFVDRQTEIRAVADAPRGAGLHVRVVDHFNNVGDRPLRSMEVRLPEGPTFGPQNLRVTINGREVSPEHASDTDRRLMREPFDPVWEHQQPREIVTEWDLKPEAAGRGTVAASAVAFYIADETALPLWLPPAGVFVRGGPNPIAASLTVVAPPDYRVLAPGKPLKPGTDGNLVAHRFKIQPSDDFLPYVVAGRYLEQNVRTPQGEVSFWTLQPLDVQQAQTAAARLASSMRAFTDFFGPALRKGAAVRIVEAPSDLPGEYGAQDEAGGGSFPGGALLDPRAFAQGVANESILELAEYELARTWFGWRVRPRPEAQILMGHGLGLFSLVAAAEGRGQDQRHRMVASLLGRYDESRHTTTDRRLLEPPEGYSRAERISTGYRAALFFVALEDLCGRDNLRAAFRQIVRARGGDEVAGEELRAAVEAASRRDLAEVFRTWIIRSGVPDDFRARYSNPPSTQGVN
jgi:hypothetical protein